MTEVQTLLPRVKELLACFNEARVAASEAADYLDHLERQRTHENVLDLARSLRQARGDLGEHVERMREAIRSVIEMGVEIKRLDPALLDFPALRDDRIVYLCWQEGESTVTHWHEVDQGFAGRQPLG